MRPSLRPVSALLLGGAAATALAIGCGARTGASSSAYEILDAAPSQDTDARASKPDASPADAGSPEASPPDAAPDAPPPDTGAPDAPPDTGPPDVGPPDTGPPDTGPPDTGPPDAGPGTFQCLWVKRFGDALEQDRIKMALAPSGNIVVVGSFYGSIDLGGGPLKSKMLNRDMFVSSFTAEGVHLWSKTFSEKGYGAYADGVAVDGDGNIHVVGYAHGALNFGEGPLPEKGQLDIYMAKLTASGEHIWSHAYGGPENQRALSVGLDAAGNTYVVGDFSGSIDLPGGPFINPKEGKRDLFFLKLNKDGSPGGSLIVSGEGDSEITSLLVGADGRQTAVGYATGKLSFGGDLLLVGPKGNHFYVELGGDFGHLNSKVFFGNDAPSGWVLARDPSGDALLAGSLIGSVDLGGGLLTNPSIEADVLLGRLGPGAAHKLSKRLGDDKSQQGTAIAASPTGSIFQGGFFESTIDLGNGKLQGGLGVLTGYLIEFSPEGEHLGSLSFGGKGEQRVLDLLALPSGDVLVAGSFFDTLDLGQGPVQSAGDRDLYLARCRPTAK